ncbi:hypothetical protein [Jannaschia faecimaris]|nr:hypothetical protein [Jannaschia faecimaris]
MKSVVFQFARVTGMVLLASVPVCMTPVRSAAQTEIETLEFSYFKLRNRTGSEAPAEFYGGERSELKAGVCNVGEVDLGVLAPLADVAPNFLREELLRVESVREINPTALLDGLEETAGARGSALYVHGCYIGFEKGVAGRHLCSRMQT